MIADRVLEGMALADRLGLIAAVLPELAALHGVEQSHFHHLDVYGHTIEVLKEQLRIERDPAAVFRRDSGRRRRAASRTSRSPTTLTRAQALRFAALTHDIAKPATRRGAAERPRHVHRPRHRSAEEVISGICRRLRTSERFREFLGAIARHHLVLGFLVHERPLDRRTVYRYLKHTSPVEVEVTLLSCADRLATRGKNADRAIELHVELARELMEVHSNGARPARPGPRCAATWLARELGMEPGPELGRAAGRAGGGALHRRGDNAGRSRRTRPPPARQSVRTCAIVDCAVFTRTASARRAT